MSTSMNIHRVASVTYQRIKFSSFYTHRFVVTTEEGALHEFDSFSSSPMDLEVLPDDMAHELKKAAEVAEAVAA